MCSSGAKCLSFRPCAPRSPNHTNGLPQFVSCCRMSMPGRQRPGHFCLALCLEACSALDTHLLGNCIQDLNPALDESKCLLCCVCVCVCTRACMCLVLGLKLGALHMLGKCCTQVPHHSATCPAPTKHSLALPPRQWVQRTSYIGTGQSFSPMGLYFPLGGCSGSS